DEVQLPHSGRLPADGHGGPLRFDAPAHDASRMDADDPRVVTGAERLAAAREHLRAATDLDAARSPGRHRREVVDDDRDVRIRARVAELRALLEAMPADVDRVGLGVVMQSHRDDLGLAL